MVIQGLLLVIWLLIVADFHLSVCQLISRHMAIWILVTFLSVSVLTIAWTWASVSLLLVTWTWLSGIWLPA